MRRTNTLYICLASTLVLTACSGLPKKGGGGNQQVAVTVSPKTPPPVNNFATQQFTAAVTGSSNTAVTWQVNGVAGGSQATGFISSTGLFVAPGAVPTLAGGLTTTVKVTAVSQANAAVSDSATVTVVPLNQNVQSGGAIKLGSSGGNAKASNTNGNVTTCCGGTLGSLLTRNGTQFILSNNHVLAISDSAHAGDAIIQPGLIDNPNLCTTTGTTTVANLTAFFNLESDPGVKVDAAIAQVVPGTVDNGGNILYLGATTTNGIPDPGQVLAGSGVLGGAKVGMLVAKSGRTTGLTCSSVLAINMPSTQPVQYQKGCGTGATFPVSYTNLVVIAGAVPNSFSAEGDSGSLIVTQSAADPVALLFGGSDTDTIGNPVSDVLKTSKFLGAGNAVPTFVGGAPHQVIGCTLPVKPAGAIQTLAASAIASEKLQRATVTRDAHAPELLSHPEVQAVGVGASFDNPEEAAILFFVTKGQPRTNLPAQVDGIRTRIIEGDLFESRGALSTEKSAALEKSAAPAQLVYSISDAEVARAKVVHAAHIAEFMKWPGVQGVGISSSVDSPGEAALMIFFIRGEAHDPIPPMIDGLRTRVRVSSRFRAGVTDAVPHRTCSLPVAKNAKNDSAATPTKP